MILKIGMSAISLLVTAEPRTVYNFIVFLLLLYAIGRVNGIKRRLGTVTFMAPQRIDR